MKKKILLMLILACMIPLSASAAIDFTIEGKKVNFNNQPFLMNNTVMLPLREVMEQFYYDVRWNGEKQQIDLIRENDTASVRVNSDVITINGNEETMSQNVLLINGTTFIPFNVVGKLISADIDWNYDKSSIAVVLNEKYRNAFAFDANALTEEVKIPSLIPNSDFEAGVEPFTARYQTTTIAEEKDNVHSGEGAVAFSGQKGTAAGIQTSVKDILLNEGDGTYVLSFWAKTNTGAVKMSVYPAKLSEGGSNPYRDYSITSDWQKFENKYNLTWGDITQAPMIFFLDTGNHSGETVYIDDILFYKE